MVESGRDTCHGASGHEMDRLGQARPADFGSGGPELATRHWLLHTPPNLLSA